MRRIIEIIGRMNQGFTEPILCRADDDQLYVVKTRSAGTTTLVKEWVAGSLAQAAGLPIPPFEIVTFDPHQARFTADPEAQNLAACPGFGSRYIEQAGDLLPAVVQSISRDLRCRILWFDWLIANGDRNDGNPNLVWVAHEQELHLIDHNNAFDDPAELTDFWDFHVFRGDRAFSDPAEKDVLDQQFRNIMGQLPAIWSELPEAWTNGCILSEQQADTILRRCSSGEFWARS